MIYICPRCKRDRNIPPDRPAPCNALCDPCQAASDEEARERFAELARQERKPRTHYRNVTLMSDVTSSHTPHVSIAARLAAGFGVLNG